MAIKMEQSIGGTLPDFNLRPVGGGEPRGLDSALSKRKGAVVIFWSAVCSHCRRYDAYLQRFSKQYPDIGLVAIASREGEDESSLTRAIADRSLEFSILHDSDRAVAKSWLVNQTPRAFLLNAEQLLVYRGAIDNFKYSQDPDYAPYLDHAIEDLLAGRAVRRAETPGFGCPTESVYYRQP